MNDDLSSSRALTRRKRIALTALTALVAIGLISGALYRSYSRSHLKTDDAFVEGAIHMISARVAGSVKAIHVENNQKVIAGVRLVELDPDVYEQRLAEAESLWRSEQKKLEEMQASLKVQQGRIASARLSRQRAASVKEELEATVLVREAELQSRLSYRQLAEADFKRYETLLREGAIAQEAYDKASTALDTATASHEAALRQLAQAELAVKSQQRQVEQAGAAVLIEESALAQLEAAMESQQEQVGRRLAQAQIERLNLSYTIVNAPADGYVTRKSVELGNSVQAGQPMMSLVSMDEAYLIANYKETVVGLIRPGQRAVIELDAYPGKRFEGHVESIMAGTGSAFSLFPPENASGNYVKVVQRVPVKIVFDDLGQALPYLRVGMSAVPTVLAN